MPTSSRVELRPERSCSLPRTRSDGAAELCDRRPQLVLDLLVARDAGRDAGHAAVAEQLVVDRACRFVGVPHALAELRVVDRTLDIRFDGAGRVRDLRACLGHSGRFLSVAGEVLRLHSPGDGSCVAVLLIMVPLLAASCGGSAPPKAARASHRVSGPGIRLLGARRLDGASRTGAAIVVRRRARRRGRSSRRPCTGWRSRTRRRSSPGRRRSSTGSPPKLAQASGGTVTESVTTTVDGQKIRAYRFTVAPERPPGHRRPDRLRPRGTARVPAALPGACGRRRPRRRVRAPVRELRGSPRVTA